MTRIFCTIFNAVYLVRGLALIESLAQHCPGHRIYVFAMDEASANTITQIGDPRVIAVRRAEFETAELLRIKPSRSLVEYYWTCTPHIVRHCLQVRIEAECTYVDADVWLMSSPEPLFAEMGACSVLLTDHRYTPAHEQAALRGRYCVQFMRFVNDGNGRCALDWWCDRCIEWCHARAEDGKFGDQKYLDDWPQRFAGVHVLRHVGGGVAPWNVGRTEFRQHAGQVQVRDGGDWQPLVFFHFHGLTSYSPDTLCFGFGYRLPRLVKALVYAAYARELGRLFQHWHGQFSGQAALGPAPGASNTGKRLRQALRRAWGFPNTYSLQRLPGL